MFEAYKKNKKEPIRTEKDFKGFQFLLVLFSFLYYVSNMIINRPGVAGAVLQSASLLIKWVSEPFPPNLQDIINHKPEELGKESFYD